MLFKLAWRNLWRNRNRTLITMGSVMFAVLLSVLIESLQTGVFDNLIKNIVGYYSSYIQIHKKGYTDEQTLDNVMIVDLNLLKKIQQHPNVECASERIETFVLASGEKNTRGCMLMSIDPDAEKRLIELDKKIIKGNYLLANDKSVLLGEQLADKLDLKVKDTIVLLGQGYQGVTAAAKYPVKGLLHFGSPDLNEKVLFMTLAGGQDFLGMQNEATTIAVALKHTKELNRTRDELQQSVGNKLEVITWEEIMPDVVEHIQTDKGSGKIISFLLYLLVSFGIFSTLLMMMAERKFEFGMLLAIGMKKRQLAYVMILESFFVTISGSFLGLLISIPLMFYMKAHPLRFTGEIAKVYERYGFEAIFPTSTDPVIFIKQTIIIIVISLLLSSYTVFRIFSINPVKSMKR